MNESLLKPSAARALLALALLAGGLLRFWEIQERGPFIWDEGIYHQEGSWIYTTLGALGDSARVFLEERRTGADLWKAEDQLRAIESKQEGDAVWAARPARGAAIGLAMLATGMKPWVGPLLSAIYGTAMILLVHHIAARWWGRDAAVASALALAVMGWHVLYSREGFVETDSVLVLGAALWFFCESAREGERRPRLCVFLAGFFWGVGVTIQVRWASLFPMLLLGEALHWVHRRRPIREHLGRVALMLVALAVPILLFELPYYPLHVVARRFGLRVTLMTYIQQTIVQALIVARSAKQDLVANDPLNWANYPYSMIAFSGPLMLALTAVGFAFALRRALPLRKAPLHEQMLLVWFVYPIVKYSLYLPRPRYYSLAFPAGALMIGALAPPLVALARRGRFPMKPAAALAAFLLLIAANAYMPIRWIPEMRLGYAEAVAFMRERGSVKHVSSAREVSKSWAGPRNVADKAPRSMEELRADYDAGYRWLLVDHWAPLMRQFFAMEGYHVPGVSETVRDSLAVVDEAARRTPPAATIPNPIGGTIQPILEMNVQLGRSLRYVRETGLAEEKVIKIYDLAEVFRDAPPSGVDGAAPPS